MALALAGNAWATSPYDLPYGVQWSFISGNSNADNPDYCGVSPDGTVWMTNAGTASGITMTWGNPGSVYGGQLPCGYGQISPLGGILQANDFPGVPGISGYNQGSAPTVYFAGNNPTAHVHLSVNSAAKWTDASPADLISKNTSLISFTLSSLAGSPPVDYNGTPSVTLPVKNAAGLDPTKKFSHELLNTNFYNGAAHDSAVASDGTIYWCTQNQNTDAAAPDMFTVGDFSGPYDKSYKLSYASRGNNENLLQKLSPGDFDFNKFVDFADVQIAGTATKPGLPGVDTYDFNGDERPAAPAPPCDTGTATARSGSMPARRPAESSHPFSWRTPRAHSCRPIANTAHHEKHDQ